MNRSKLAGIIGGCIVVIVVIVAIVTHMFAPTYNLGVNVSPSGAGSVSPSSGQYKSGAQVTLTASPTSGYIFDHWSGAVSGNTSSIAISMDSDKNVTANFRPPGELTITSASTTKDLIYVGDDFCVTGVIKNTGNVPIFAANAIEAKFEPEDAVEVDEEPLCGSLAYFELDPGNGGELATLCSCPNYSWFRASESGPVTCTITASWCPDSSASTTYTVTKTFTFNITTPSSPAVFYTLATNTSGQGYTYPSPGTRMYHAGTSVVITAIPYKDWEFDHWEGDASGTNMSTTVAMDGNKTITAVFVEQQ